MTGAVGQIVTFEETNEHRVIRRRCRRCERTWEGQSEDWSIVSPWGTAHAAKDDDYGGVTACGIDATGDRWWWQW